MGELSSYINYEEKVLSQLLEVVNHKYGENTNLQTHYKYYYENKAYEFDLVVFGGDNQILDIYEIKTPSAVKSKYNYIQEQLLCYKEITGANVYLVYSDKDGQLKMELSKDAPNFNGNNLRLDEMNCVLCVLPKLNNNRIISQNGAFFIFGMGDSKDKPAEFKDSPITIKIKATCKREILRELQILGIDDATLFPETDKIMRQIKSQFTEI